MGDETAESYPPYPDSETTAFSGEGDEITDSFDLHNDGPLILEVEHDGDGRFVAFAVDENEDFVPGGPTVQATGPYRGSSIHALAEGTYSLEIEASGEWAATVHDVPAYEDGTGLSLPIEQPGELGGVIGPIDFGEPSETQITVEFSGDDELNRAELITREGEPVGALVGGRNDTIGGSDDDAETETAADDTDNDETSVDNEAESDTETSDAGSSETQVISAGGVGYLSLESSGEWTARVSNSE